MAARALYRLCLKSRRFIENAAPTARNMKARGKRKAQRSASPLGYIIKALAALKGRNTNISALQALSSPLLQPGATRSAALALAPGFHIPRRWRWFTYTSDFRQSALYTQNKHR